MTQLHTTRRDLWESAYLYATEALFIADADGKLSHWSESFATTVGLAAARETALHELFHEDDRKALAAAWSALQDTSGPVEMRGRVLTAGNIYAYFSCVLRRAPHDEAVYGSLQPAPGALHHAAGEPRGGAPADMLRALSDNLPVIVWAINGDGLITHHDGRGLSTLGLRRGQLVGANLFDVYSNSPDGTESVKRALLGLPMHSLSHTAANNTFWENWMVPIQDPQGNVESVIGLSLDISEAKRAEEELRVRLMQIQKQQEVIGKLSTPIIQVWEGVIALPMVGIVDSVRTADVMQKLLDEIVRTGARYAILDLTGVDMVDTQVANHLIRLVRAIQLLGAGGIICGIQPSVAQTIVELGLDLTSMVTRANLKAGIKFCISQMSQLATTAEQAAR
ncbi:PAS domain-containing protein [Sorangium sp. So ce315]|uniref:PAS domain-containing protein n=1 Tax=Sorangium sp. So ce315 TaxID=3133299 RepID=UPI003F5EB495